MSRRHVGSRHSDALDKGCYSRIFVGDAEFTDDPNDDWLCISFNRIYVGDFTPCSVYIHRTTGRVKTQDSSVFCRLMQAMSFYQ